ncbi:hypothetical protein RLQ00_001639 [Salmonella enterica]|uniref:hypothetical protein n=1 Tax=Citrobacter freundii TaxID=546 RepID=UPI0014146D41|nr:hypothetical protein [Citrobacter freundii]EAZ5991673.1 hypothetical protein [Salmonella enterica]EBY2261593.1 hypothetical protein [Salmonella enterica subsp. enterica serovar Newport]EBJ0730100.1 hypothetical protein [Salmonella enterica]ECO6783079.1 hypothetical protein [Salmonella enterica]ECO7514836.1 hypothetical protein [Salmonella enterica]
MGGRDLNYQIVYRGEELERFIEGGWVFFQRLKEYGGGYWLGRTYYYAFIFTIDKPLSLGEGINYIISQETADSRSKALFQGEDDKNLPLF